MTFLLQDMYAIGLSVLFLLLHDEFTMLIPKSQTINLVLDFAELKFPSHNVRPEEQLALVHCFNKFYNLLTM